MDVSDRELMGAVELSVEVKVELAQTGEDVMAAIHSAVHWSCSSDFPTELKRIYCQVRINL